MRVVLLRWLRLLLALALLACGVTACDGRLAGLRDVVMRYAVASGAEHGDDLRERVTMRLASAEVTADVTLDRAGQVTVRVDEGYAEDVGKLLGWQGGVVLAAFDDDGARSSPREDSPGHRRVLERPRDGRGRADAETVDETVAWPPIVELSTELLQVDGPRLRIPLDPEAETRLAKAIEDAPSRLAVVRDRSVIAVLAPGAVENHHLVVSLGDTIVAYTLAADLGRLLASPRLPPLVLASKVPAARDWWLASLNLLLPFAVSFAWLFFVRRFDRAQPEPMWLVVATFALGAVAVVPAGLLEWGWDSLSPYTNPTLLTFGRSARAFPVALVGFIVTVGLSEEGAKLLATWSLATHRREFDEPVDGIVYGAAAALGFAAAENLRYLAVGRVEGTLVASRAFMSVPAHLFFGTIWGYALGRRLVDKRRRVWPLFLAAVTLHGLFDTCLSVEGGLLPAVGVALLVASIFMVHLRKALRHGAVERGAPGPEDRGPRELFRMGSRGVFACFVALVYLLSATMFLLTLLERSGRTAVTLGVVSAVVLGLLGWAARGVAATLPLDVVIDDEGVTFAGAAILYREVQRIERKRLVGSLRKQEEMRIVGAGRRLILGPASQTTVDALSHALALRLSSVALRR